MVLYSKFSVQGASHSTPRFRDEEGMQSVLDGIADVAVVRGISFAQQPHPGKALIPCDVALRLVVRPSNGNMLSDLERATLHREGYDVPEASAVLAIVMTAEAYEAVAEDDDHHLVLMKARGATHILTGLIFNV